MNVFIEFNKWLLTRGNGQYAHDDFHGVTPIQQIKQEITDLVDVIKHLSGDALEIGLGVYGGTHMLWRLLFDNVITIDNDESVVRDFIQRENLDSRSIILAGDSKNIEIKQEFCFLHIDGDHTYDGVKNDYVKFSKNVKGIIAIHDALFPSVKQFLEDLENGNIDGNQHKINRIIHSRRVGIAYEYRGDCTNP
jgi:hypothetical protein